MRSELDETLQNAVDAGDVPGVVAFVVDADGTRYEGAFGERSLGSGMPMTLDTVGGIQSMTKALTGVAAMQLVEQGRLSLDAPASEVCPELGEAQVLDGVDADGATILRPPTSDVTLRNLLTHTSGFAYDLWDADLDAHLERTGHPRMSERTLETLVVPLSFDPGTRWRYGIGIDWAGQMIERVSGMRLGDYFAEHVCGPLGMVDTSYAMTEVMAARASSLHFRRTDGGFDVAPLSVAVDPEIDFGGGDMFGTMPDYARLLRMMLRGGELDGERLLRPETIDLMAQNHIGELRVEPAITTNLVVSADAEFFPGTPKGWGLTWQVDLEPQATGRPAGTLMWAGLFNSFYWIDRVNGVAACFMSQVLPFADPRIIGALERFETAVYDSLRST